MAISGLCCHLKPCWCSWDKLPQGIILAPMACVALAGLLMSLICAAAEGCAVVCGLYCPWRLCWSVACADVGQCGCQWSMVLLEIHDSRFCWLKRVRTLPLHCIDDCRLRVGTWRASVTTPTLTLDSTPKSNNLDRKPSKKMLKTCDKDAEG